MKLVLAALLLGAPAAPEWTTLRCGDEEVSVYRDLWGIQHIFAKSAKAAFWAEGYTEAEDRLWQMETLRRGAKGQAAELQGKAALANDRDRARRGYTEAELQQLVDSERLQHRRHGMSGKLSDEPCQHSRIDTGVLAQRDLKIPDGRKASLVEEIEIDEIARFGAR